MKSDRNLVLGEGKARRVYVHPDNPDWVIKELTWEEHFNWEGNPNRTEWKVWQTVQGTEYEKHFCPCIALIENDRLIMRRCEPCTDYADGNLNLLGVNIRDTKKAANCGMLDGRRVIIDYGQQDALDFLKKLKET